MSCTKLLLFPLKRGNLQSSNRRRKKMMMIRHHPQRIGPPFLVFSSQLALTIHQLVEVLESLLPILMLGNTCCLVYFGLRELYLFRLLGWFCGANPKRLKIMSTAAQQWNEHWSSSKQVALPACRLIRPSKRTAADCSVKLLAGLGRLLQKTRITFCLDRCPRCRSDTQEHAIRWFNLGMSLQAVVPVHTAQSEWGRETLFWFSSVLPVLS